MAFTAKQRRMWGSEEKRNEALWDKYEDDINKIQRLGIVPPKRNCFNDRCGREFKPVDLVHIYCTKECQRQKEIDEHFNRSVNDINKAERAIEKVFFSSIEGAKLKDGVVTCCNCNGKISGRDFEIKKNNKVYCLRCGDRTN